MRPGFLILIFIAGAFLFFILIDKKKNEVNKSNLENLNLTFSGIVTDVDEVQGYNGYGIIRMNIISSNMKEYDVRNTSDFYYCIIKNGIAEVYDHAFKRLLGDTINIDTKKRISSLGGYDNEHDIGSISINPSRGYYEYIKHNSIFR